MRDLWDTRVAQGRGLVTVPKQLSSLGVKRLMERAIWAQGLRKKLEPGKKRHPYQANHSLRKWFKTRYEIAGMKPINIEKLMNHSVGISDSYYRATENELLEDYLKAIDLLSISNSTNKLENQISELKQKNKDNECVIRGKLEMNNTKSRKNKAQKKTEVLDPDHFTVFKLKNGWEKEMADLWSPDIIKKFKERQELLTEIPLEVHLRTKSDKSYREGWVDAAKWTQP